MKNLMVLGFILASLAANAAQVEFKSDSEVPKEIQALMTAKISELCLSDVTAVEYSSGYEAVRVDNGTFDYFYGTLFVINRGTEDQSILRVQAASFAGNNPKIEEVLAVRSDRSFCKDYFKSR